jgi:hypothetical protein
MAATHRSGLIAMEFVTVATAVLKIKRSVLVVPPQRHDAQRSGARKDTKDRVRMGEQIHEHARFGMVTLGVTIANFDGLVVPEQASMDDRFTK